MNVNEFFDFAEQMVLHVFNEQGHLNDMAVMWTGKGKEIATASLASGGVVSANYLREVVERDGYIAYATAFETSIPSGIMLSGEGRVLDEAVIFKSPRPPTLHGRAIFMFMASEDGSRRVRAFEIKMGNKSAVGKRLPQLEDVQSPFLDLYHSPPPPIP